MLIQDSVVILELNLYLSWSQFDLIYDCLFRISSLLSVCVVNV